ncbi:MAG: diguanylate cyclase [Methylococcaceae bacterium]|nr:MAG: diguanylate cyclase [Methylococcaceae bacterium]
MSHKPLVLKPSSASTGTGFPKNKAHWTILVVDDDEEVHAVTRLILSKVNFKNRGIKLLDAYSAAEAAAMLTANPDIAIILLDVVMESDDAGLQLVRRIRHEFANPAVRIILRTGQPGQAPEERVIVDYDIDDYKAKSELTSQKLFTAIIAGLRSYEIITSLEKNRRGLEKILECSDTLFKEHSMRQFASGVLTQLSAFLECKPNGILCIVEEYPLPAGECSAHHACGGLRVLASSGEYAACLDCKLGDECRHQEIAEHINRAIREHSNQYTSDYTVLFLNVDEAGGTVALLHCDLEADANDRRLLSLFASKIAIGLSNAIYHEKLITAEEAAVTDVLTGLNNRRQLLRLSLPLAAGVKRAGVACAVAVLDIDHFKSINDNYGHDAGDAVLRRVGELMKNRFRSSDIVARIGGEEFCVVATQIPPDQAFTLFNDFRNHLAEEKIIVADQQLSVTVSIGVSTRVRDSIEDMVIAADALLYQAKQSGRNRVIIDSPQSF